MKWKEVSNNPPNKGFPDFSKLPYQYAKVIYLNVNEWIWYVCQSYEPCEY